MYQPYPISCRVEVLIGVHSTLEQQEATLQTLTTELAQITATVDNHWGLISKVCSVGIKPCLKCAADYQFSTSSQAEAAANELKSKHDVASGC